MFTDERTPRVCEAGEAIFSTFDMGFEMYVVLEGQVELTIARRRVWPPQS
ncbi:MAG: hypothetical protein ACXWAC_12230 [Usitatibacter sp.]